MLCLLKLKKENSFFTGFLFCLILFCSSVGAAQEIFNSYITVNSVVFDEPVWVEFYDEKSKDNKVQIDPIIESLRSVLAKEFIDKILSSTDLEGKITFRALNDMGIKTSVDVNTLDLKLQVRKEDKKLTNVSVSGRQRTVKTTNSKVLKPDFLSGYLNLRGTAEISGTSREDVVANDYKNSSSLSAEAVLNIGGVALESQYLYSDRDLVSNDRWNRLYSRIVIDDQKRSTRYTVGDLNHSSRGFQDLILGAGFGFEKEFSIQPSFFRSSFKKHKFYLDTDSIVEIFVNGNLVRRKTLPQGPVELSDFPFNSGENEVSLRITDRFGVIKNLRFSDISDTRLLSVGLTDFSFNILFPRKNETLSLDFEDDYATDDVVFTGFYHVGAFENFVAGADLQYNKRRALLGLESVYGGSIGITKLNLAGSTDSEVDKNGLGVRLEYESLFFKKGALSNFRIFSSLEHKSQAFSDFLLGQTNIKYRARFTVGQNFRNSIRASLGFNKDWFYNNNHQAYITSNFGWTLYRNFDFSSNVRVNLDDGEDTTVLLSLNWNSRNTNQQSTSTYNPIDNVITTELTSLPIEGRQNFRTYVGGETNESAKRVTAGIDFFNQRIETRASHTASFAERGGTDNVTRANLGVGLAFVGTSVALTKPVENAFALVSVKGRPRGYSVPINRGFNSQRGEVNFFGPASLTNLAPYYEDKAVLDITNLPYGYSLDQESFRFMPSYKRGLRIRAHVDGETSVSGRALFDNGSPAEYVTGILYDYSNGVKGEELQQIFTGANGFFSIERIKAGTYALSFETEDYNYKDIVISVDSVVGVYELSKDLVLKR